MADTSYSDMSSADNRGSAVCEVCLLRTGHVRVHGRLQDGSELDYTLAPPGMGTRGELVGRLEPPPGSRPRERLVQLLRRFLWCGHAAAGSDGDSESVEQYFIKAKLKSGDVLLCHHDKFLCKYHVMRARDAYKAFGPWGKSVQRCVSRHELVISQRLARRPSRRRSWLFMSYTSTGDEALINEDLAEARHELVDEIFRTPTSARNAPRHRRRSHLELPSPVDIAHSCRL